MTDKPQIHKRKILTQEEKMNVDIIKRIMSEKKTTLASLRHQDWRTVKSETDKMNDLLTNIPTNDITESDDLIYVEAKLVCEKNQGLPEDYRQKVKTRITDKETTTTSKNTKTEH